MQTGRTFTGFGFGAIQSGLFAYEAYRCGGFKRMVIAEVVPETVAGIRAAGGAFAVNIAQRDCIESETVAGCELYNPLEDQDREALIHAVAQSSEIATALPSVDFYGGRRPGDVVAILCAGLERKNADGGPPAIIYTAENNNHAAEILSAALLEHGGSRILERAVCLNTVIGKMSGVVTDPAQIAEQRLQPVTPGAQRAFLVEAFNRILISQVPAGRGFERMIKVFEEKPDLLPFEEAKLYGHNATHALIGYLLAEQGIEFMDAAASDRDLLGFARAAFVEESGAALCRRYAGIDPLFTADGYAAYADDLLERMMNPHLRDRVERVTRDPRRKLAWNDRLIGTMRLALSQGIRPARYARGAAAALRALAAAEQKEVGAIVDELWPEAEAGERAAVAEML